MFAGAGLWKKAGVWAMAVLAAGAAFGLEGAPNRIIVIGDSWPMFMNMARAFTYALQNRGLTDIDWSYTTHSAIGGSEIYEWAYNTGKAEGALDEVVNYLHNTPTIDMVVLTMGGNDFLGVWEPGLTPEQEQAIWDQATYGADGQHGLKLIFDRLLAVRPDIKIIFSSYDYISWHKDDWTMADVQAYNVANEKFSQGMIDFINAEYKNPPRVFFLNNLGLMQYRFGFPGPNPESIANYYWPVTIPGNPPVRTAEGFHFNPGPASSPGDPPLFPGNEASGYVPLGGGDPNFRISPYVSLMSPPADGWIHLSPEGYIVVAENAIDQYIAEWSQYPKVYDIQRIEPNPLNPGQIFDPTNKSQLTFEVTFSKPVLGVDEADFEPVMHGGVANASINSVVESKASTTYVVTVNTGTGDGTLGLAAIDNDSIQNLSGGPLGGPGTGNGYYAQGAPYHIDRSASLPVAAWPAVLLLIGAGAALIRRR